MASACDRFRVGRGLAMLVTAASGFIGVGTVLAAERPAALAPGIEDIEPTVEAIRSRHDLPGMVAAVFDSDRILAAGAAGTRKVGSGVPLAVDDKFPVASIAKTMTATLVAELVDRGLLTWDTPLEKLYPEIADLRPEFHQVTIDLLLRHAAGLPRWMRSDEAYGEWCRSHPGATPSVLRYEAVKFILRRSPEFPPGARYHYTNDSYLVLGNICERVSGRSYEALLRERIFDALQMTHSGFGEPWVDRSLQQPWGHIRRWYGFRPVDPRSVDEKSMPFGSPYGANVHGSVLDLANYGRFHLRGDRDLNAALSKDSFRRLHHAPRAPDGPGEIPAAGFFNGGRREVDGRWTEVQHWGYYARGRTLLWFSPQADVGVVILTNGTDEEEEKGMQPLRELASQLFRRYKTTTR